MLVRVTVLTKPGGRYLPEGVREIKKCHQKWREIALKLQMFRTGGVS